MPRFLDTSGRAHLGIGICDRCKFKFSIDDLGPDPNANGILVCMECTDEYDPYRLPPPPPDDIRLPNYRPDSDVSVTGPETYDPNR